ncbi:hypothetical protein QCA50_006438 [Cerrena zonata]|uniref:Major facilitator superfamily (MFS) profile domain-containing protein n=1 Tax=Cerrena zonata TaxID=2478898 RepID=A0AAW0GJ65_9APHY
MSGSLRHTKTTAPVVTAPKQSPLANEKPDIEHADVTDDPRKWSTARKTAILVTISGAAIIVGLGGNLYNPAIAQIESDLHASSGGISWSISLFILVQGCFPLVWSAISEIYGRKVVYIASFAFGIVGCIIAANAKTIGVLIGMRVIQAAGSSSVLSMGAATLSDLYDPQVRGTMMGIFYSAPLLGPALGPIIGGALTQAFNWRATFWFIAAFSGLCLLAFVFFSDTFRRERSLTYQTVLRRRLQERARHEVSNTSGRSSMSHDTMVSADHETRKDKMYPETSDGVPPVQKPAGATAEDLEAQKMPNINAGSSKVVEELKEIRLSFKDINPIRPIFLVLSRRNNLAILFSSGLLFAFSYSLAYTCSRTLSLKYEYDALTIGLVLLSFGIGSVLGSVLGGRWSDGVLAYLKSKNGGVSHPEMRLESTFIWMLFLPLSSAAYGWVAEKHVHVAAICVFLFLSGFFSIAIYASTLAYIVDANIGRSSPAVATNSTFRGLSAFVATEIAVPLQLAMGDGGLYTLWAGIIVISELLLLLVWWKGRSWREQAEKKESQ